MKECGCCHESADDFRHKFLVKLERKETFHCFCDEDKCLTKKKYSKSDAIHSLLWPALYLVILTAGLLLWKFYFKGECCTPCSQRHSARDSSEKSGAKEGKGDTCYQHYMLPERRSLVT